MTSPADAPKRYPEERIPFVSADGVECDVIHVRGKDKPTKGPVLLVHGVGVRSEIWQPPLPYTLV